MNHKWRIKSRRRREEEEDVLSKVEQEDGMTVQCIRRDKGNKTVPYSSGKEIKTNNFSAFHYVRY